MNTEKEHYEPIDFYNLPIALGWTVEELCNDALIGRLLEKGVYPYAPMLFPHEEKAQFVEKETSRIEEEYRELLASLESAEGTAAEKGLTSAINETKTSIRLKIFETLFNHSKELLLERLIERSKGSVNRMSGLPQLTDEILGYYLEHIEEGQRLVVMYIDMDGLTDCNETLGHEIVDKQVLPEFGRRLSASLRTHPSEVHKQLRDKDSSAKKDATYMDQDLVLKVGSLTHPHGDELVCILDPSHGAGAEDAQKIAKRILEQVLIKPLEIVLDEEELSELETKSQLKDWQNEKTAKARALSEILLDSKQEIKKRVSEHREKNYYVVQLPVSATIGLYVSEKATTCDGEVGIFDPDGTQLDIKKAKSRADKMVNLKKLSLLGKGSVWFRDSAGTVHCQKYAPQENKWYEISVATS